MILALLLLLMPKPKKKPNILMSIHMYTTNLTAYSRLELRLYFLHNIYNVYT